MKLISKEGLETNKHELKLEVTPEEFDAAINAIFKKESKNLNVPGFRQGKAPRAFIEKLYGLEMFYEPAINHIYRDMVTQAIDQSELEVVSVIDFAIDEASKEKGVLAKLIVVTKPEISIKDYKGIAATKEPVEVADEEIDAEIERVRERNSRMVSVEDRAAKDGDIVTIDFDGYTDGKQFDGGKAENFELTLGAGQFIPGFEEQVVDHNIGEEFDVNVTFPEDYHADELMGKDAVFKIKIHEIKMKELPEVDDEFVKDVSEFDTLDEYKNDTKENIAKHKEEHVDAAVENQIVDVIIEKVEGEIPDEMIENEIDEIINSFAYRLQSQGLNLETYLQYTGASVEDLREQYKEQAERQVKVRLGLEKIAEIEKIESSDKEVEDEIKKMSEEYGMPEDSIKNLVSNEAIAADIKNRKTLDFLKENAKITEAKPEKASAKKAAPKKPTDDKEEKKPAAKATKSTTAAKPTAKPAAKKAEKKDEE